MSNVTLIKYMFNLKFFFSKCLCLKNIFYIIFKKILKNLTKINVSIIKIN